MQAVQVALLLLFAVGVLECANERKAFQRHIANVNLYPCGDPQPRVFEADKLISKDIYAEGTINPAVTVLHRCFNAGCCKKNTERCAPAHMEEVTVTFSVLHKYLKFVDVQLTNHTRCTCSNTYNEIDNAIS
ncbi:uncharacterized protein LOC108914426 [Anoplophora glabripennis]|uniref:uncharacterized protein LOC108914426 n=1 Tax=Anoplophora glabripennis TaxID=217634 RepID=UPI000874655D|nr:uncharacterized protein LOC108914426 [Anoplophora glabripennis]